MNISVQNKQNKKDTFFSNPKFWLFGDFLKLEVFPEENPTQKPANSLEPRRNWQKISKMRSQIWLFWPEIVKIFEKDHKITVVDIVTYQKFSKFRNEMKEL